MSRGRQAVCGYLRNEEVENQEALPERGSGIDRGSSIEDARTRHNEDIER